MRRLATLLAFVPAACAVPAPDPAVPSTPPGTPVVVTLGDSVPAGSGFTGRQRLDASLV